MTINDGKGLWDKYGLISEIKKKMEVLAEAKGTLRCGLIWDIANMIKALEDNLKKDDETRPIVGAINTLADPRDELNAQEQKAVKPDEEA